MSIGHAGTLACTLQAGGRGSGTRHMADILAVYKRSQHAIVLPMTTDELASPAGRREGSGHSRPFSFLSLTGCIDCLRLCGRVAAASTVVSGKACSGSRCHPRTASSSPATSSLTIFIIAAVTRLARADLHHVFLLGLAGCYPWHPRTDGAARFGHGDGHLCRSWQASPAGGLVRLAICTISGAANEQKNSHDRH